MEVFTIMVNEKPLYKDPQIKIDYLLRSVEDHELTLSGGGDEPLSYILFKEVY